jgi:regulator of replication initiation timing
MATIVETLGKELEQIDREYSAEFAGQSRLSRDVSSLDRILKRTQSIVERVEQIPTAARGPDLVRLRDAATQSLALYQAERAAIVRAQEVGPTFEQFSAEATNANFVFARYGRHFAGKDRATRDVALLGELVEDLKQIEKRMSAVLEEQKTPDFERDRQVVRENLAQYQKEIELIEQAQTAGTPEEQASILATLANNQFAVYQAHFAGEPRVSRRPALLMRVVSTLKKIRERMVALREGGLDVDFNAKNIAIVEDRLRVYETELGEVRKVRQATPMTEIMGELGGAANKLFDDYRGSFADKPRNQADDTKLGNLCDKLGEIRRQMVEMSWAEDNEMNAKNLDIVTEQLVMFEGEYEAVVRAKSQTTSA